MYTCSQNQSTHFSLGRDSEVDGCGQGDEAGLQRLDEPTGQLPKGETKLRECGLCTKMEAQVKGATL